MTIAIRIGLKVLPTFGFGPELATGNSSSRVLEAGKVIFDLLKLFQASPLCAAGGLSPSTGARNQSSAPKRATTPAIPVISNSAIAIVRSSQSSKIM